MPKTTAKGLTKTNALVRPCHYKMLTAYPKLQMVSIALLYPLQLQMDQFVLVDQVDLEHLENLEDLQAQLDLDRHDQMILSKGRLIATKPGGPLAPAVGEI